MRKLILFNMVTLDGFFEGPNRDIFWHNVDEEFNEFAIQQIDSVDMLIFGRVTYELMASYWPTSEAIADDPLIADKMNSMPKIVFSWTLSHADWQNTRLVTGNAPEEIASLKQQPGKDLIIFGSANLAASLIQDGLIDEFRVMVNPVVLGQGTPLFQGIKDKLNLKLQQAKVFRSGNVLLIYQPESE